MTEDELRAIEARANAASPGPWAWDDRYDAVIDANRQVVIDTDGGYNMESEADRAFTIHAREDVPALIAEVRECWDAIWGIKPAER